MTGLRRWNPTGRLNYMNQLTMMPDAIWPTAAAPTAPTPLNTAPHLSSASNQASSPPLYE